MIDARWRFRAMQLHGIDPGTGNDTRQQIIIGINGERDLADGFWHPRRQACCFLDGNIAGRGRKEHKTGQAGTSRNSGVDVPGFAKPANFDDGAHTLPVPVNHA